MAACGNRDAFSTLYDRYFERLCYFAFGFVRDRDQCQDIVQEVFLQLIQAPGAFDKERTFSTWIYTVTRNRCLNQIRNDSNRQRLRAEWGQRQVMHTEHVSSLDAMLLHERLAGAVKSLGERDAHIFRLRFEEEKSIREIASAVKAPEGTVKSALYYILRKIARQIKELADA